MKRIAVFIFTLHISALTAFAGGALKRSSFGISDSFFLPDQNMIMLQVDYGCGCGESLFKFKNFKKDPARKEQQIDMELMGNNSCKMACKKWQPLSLSQFPEISAGSDLIINELGPVENSFHRFDFKKIKPKSETDIIESGLLNKFKRAKGN